MKNLISIAAISAALCAYALGAAPLSLEEAVQKTLANNPSLKAAQFITEKARARLVQSGKWPNPELELSGMTEVTRQDEGQYSVGLYQSYPFTSRLMVATAVGRIDLLWATREIRNQERLLIEQVQLRYLGVLKARAKADALNRQLELAAKELALVQERIATGQSGVAEKSLALVEERRLWNERATAQKEAELGLLELKTILGMKAEAPLDLGESLDAVTARLAVRKRPQQLNRPDVEMVLFDLERSELEQKLSRSDVWQPLRFGIRYTRDRSIDEPEDLRTDHFAGLSVSLPLPVWDRKQGVRQERLASRDQAKARVEALRLEVENSVSVALRKMELLRSRLEELEASAMRPVAAAESELAQGFEQGRVDLRDLLAFQRQRSELELERIALRSELAEAAIALEASAGSHPAVGRQYLNVHTNPTR